MNLTARNSGGYQLVARQQWLRPWYPTNRVRPVRVDVYVRNDDEVAAAARFLGSYAPGQAVRIMYPVATQRTLILSTVSISPNGVRSVRELADAYEVQHSSPVGRDTEPAARTVPSLENNFTVPTGVRYPDRWST